MKNFTRSLRLKDNKVSISFLQAKLFKKLREQFDYRVQLKLGQFNKCHVLKKIGRDIASIKNVLSKKK